MPGPTPAEVTAILRDWRQGNQDALERLMPVVYAELRRLARYHLQGERPGHTLQPTALVNEAYLRLIDQKGVTWQNRAHFFGVAAQMMRRILVDHARSHLAQKRGGAQQRVTIDAAENLAAETRQVDVVALDDALNGLAALDERQSRVVELRFFGGLTNEETAEALGISPATVKREWTVAKAYLRSQISQ